MKTILTLVADKMFWRLVEVVADPLIFLNVGQQNSRSEFSFSSQEYSCVSVQALSSANKYISFIPSQVPTPAYFIIDMPFLSYI
jgi:hypothetical protein